MAGVIPDSTLSHLCALFLVVLVSICLPLNLQAKETSHVVAVANQRSSSDSAITVPEKPRLGLVVGHAGIDPDTGMHDPGFRCPDGLTEVKVNRAIARVAASGLENLGFRVDLMDEFDKRLMGYRAVALISIHTDNCDPGDMKATGYKVAGAVSTGTPQRSQQLVDCLVERYGRATNLAYRAETVTYDMADFHTFSEINTQTPAAIIETGYLFLDRDFVTQQPDNAALGIIDGIQCYVYQQPIFDERTPIPLPKK